MHSSNTGGRMEEAVRGRGRRDSGGTLIDEVCGRAAVLQVHSCGQSQSPGLPPIHPSPCERRPHRRLSKATPPLPPGPCALCTSQSAGGAAALFSPMSWAFPAAPGSVSHPAHAAPAFLLDGCSLLDSRARLGLVPSYLPGCPFSYLSSPPHLPAPQLWSVPEISPQITFASRPWVSRVPGWLGR